MEASARFPGCRRLSRKRDFDAVFEKGHSAADSNLVVYALPTELGLSRLGMAVGRKHGNAAARNRIKRLIREAFRLNAGKLPDSADIVVVPRTAVRTKLEEIAGSLVRLCSILTTENTG